MQLEPVLAQVADLLRDELPPKRFDLVMKQITRFLGAANTGVTPEEALSVIQQRLAAAPAPKRRGRPPKAAAAPADPPKRRGRPPKAAVAEAPAPKRRGRPPKAAVAAAPAVAAEWWDNPRKLYWALYRQESKSEPKPDDAQLIAWWTKNRPSELAERRESAATAVATAAAKASSLNGRGADVSRGDVLAL